MRRSWFVGPVWLVLAASTICAAGDRQSFSIRMERNGCYGNCPIYAITISSDGTVRWEGKEFVRVKGVRTARISDADVKRIRVKIAKINIFGLKNEYEPEVTDGPREATIFKQGGKKKTIISEGTTPQGLVELHSLIDEVCKSQQWIFITREVLDELWWKDAKLRASAADYMEEAIGWDDGALIRSLARKGVNVNGLTKGDRWAYLLEAVRSDRPQAVEALLDAGAEKDFRVSIYTGHIFTYAAIRTDFPESVLDSFLKRGLPIDLVNENGDTALTAAARWLKAENVAYLVAKGAKVNHRGRNGSPLLAVTQGLEEMKKNFSFCEKPRDAETAASCKEWLSAAQIKHDKIRALLLSKGAVE